jgi:hypothetical protein
MRETPEMGVFQQPAGVLDRVFNWGPYGWKKTGFAVTAQ